MQWVKKNEYRMSYDEQPCSNIFNNTVNGCSSIRLVIRAGMRRVCAAIGLRQTNIKSNRIEKFVQFLKQFDWE